MSDGLPQAHIRVRQEEPLIWGHLDACFAEEFHDVVHISDVREALGPDHNGAFLARPKRRAHKFDGASVAIGHSDRLAKFIDHKEDHSPPQIAKEGDFLAFEALSPLLLTLKFIILNYNFPTASP